ITGYTASLHFPTKNAYQPANARQYDAFVARFNTAGNGLVYSTYLGGSAGTFGDAAASVDVNYAGNAVTAVVTGDTDSTDFPTTPGAYQPAYGGGADDAFVARIAPDGDALLYSTYLGGTLDDYVNQVAVDHQGRAHVVGFTNS